MKHPHTISIATPNLEYAIRTIASKIEDGAITSPQDIATVLRKLNKGLARDSEHVKKRQLLPFYFHVKEHDEARFESWNLSEQTQKRLVGVLQTKPRRTASGVATITVLTKPWPCSGTCLFCPNDLRMPKSYIANEPACQRAEQSFFDPYLQVYGRLSMLASMGHPIDKIELIVLGGTFTEYPSDYQRWFVHELFCALNDGVSAAAKDKAKKLRKLYLEEGISNDPKECAKRVAALQNCVDAGELTYNEAWKQLYPRTCAIEASVSLADIETTQAKNETAQSRCVGLSFETRPDAINSTELWNLRRLGATKIQIGVQSTREALLSHNAREMQRTTITHAFSLLRAFGFKIQAHFMLNLLGATPQSDETDYKEFVENPCYKPDEIKLYPCSLIEGTELERIWKENGYSPYSVEILAQILANDIAITPPFIRVSRMIRDFSATSIVAGNKQGNLRQVVEEKLAKEHVKTQEIRKREIALASTKLDSLHLEDYCYTTETTCEHFLQWIDTQDRLHGFLRLSLPLPYPNDAVCKTTSKHISSKESNQVAQETQRGDLGMNNKIPLCPNDAIIREVHIYGRVAELGEEGVASQHRGLGKQLIRHAQQLARQAGFSKLFVISAVGTRMYYESLGFTRNGCYQVINL